MPLYQGDYKIFMTNVGFATYKCTAYTMYYYYTWEHLPYMAGGKSGREPAKVGRLNRTFFCGSTCRPWQVYGHVDNLPTLAG